MSDHTPTPYFPDNLEDYAPWVSRRGLTAPYGKCQCGCGQDAPISPVTNRLRRGYLAGHPVAYIVGHVNGAKQTLAEAFWQYVIPGEPDECWKWQGNITVRGYGVLRHKATSSMQIKAHRVSYQLHYGPIPEGWEACHTCDNPPCVNPNHLFAGTVKDNYDDMVAKGRHDPAFAPKLSIDQCMEILGLRQSGSTLVSLSLQYGVSWSTIARAVTRAERQVVK